MSRIMGTQPTAFDTKDGKHIEGTNIHLAAPIDPKRGRGEEGEKIFLSTAKLAMLDFTPEVGQEVRCFYNRFGRVESLDLVSEPVDFGGKP